MKKFIYLVVAVCMLTTACDIERSDNGDLDGLWQLRAADTLATGGMADLHASQTWWAFQGKIVHMHDSVAAHPDVVGHFVCTASTLTLLDLSFSVREQGDVRVEDADALNAMGLHSLNEDMRLLTLNASTMVVETSRLRLHFKKR